MLWNLWKEKKFIEMYYRSSVKYIIKHVSGGGYVSLWEYWKVYRDILDSQPVRTIYAKSLYARYCNCTLDIKTIFN